MEIETIEIGGLASALVALRLPYGKEMRSEVWGIGDNEEDFVREVSEEGTPREELYFGYGKRMCIDPRDLSLMNTLLKRGPEHAKVLRGVMAWARITAPIYWWSELETYVVGHQRLCSESTMHTDCRGLSGEALVSAKASIPMGRELTKVDVFSYQALRNIYRQRHDHRLPEWHRFCAWVETLPFADELILDGALV